MMLLCAVLLMLSGCSSAARPYTLTVSPYTLSEREDQVVLKSGGGDFQFFVLNGKPGSDEAVALIVEKWENGTFTGETTISWGGQEDGYREALLSFGTIGGKNEDPTRLLVTGVPSGTNTRELNETVRLEMTCQTIPGEVRLKKEEPVYFAMWQGSDGESLSCATNGIGALPDDVKTADVAYLYKTIWTDEKNLENK